MGQFIFIESKAAVANMQNAKCQIKVKPKVAASLKIGLAFAYQFHVISFFFTFHCDRA